MRDEVEEALKRAERVLVLIYPSFSRVRTVEISKDEARKLFEGAALGQEPRLEWDGAVLALFLPIN